MACRAQHEEQSGGSHSHSHEHGHGHGGDGGGHSHEHGNTADEESMAGRTSLFEYIDTPKIRAMNEHEPDACRRVIKPWHERLETSKFVRSDADEELIIFIPFTEVVRLRSISIVGGGDEEAPNRMRVFINRDDIDFDMAQAVAPVQEWDLVHEAGVCEYITKFSKFNSVMNITLHFPSNFGAENTTISYIGLKGESTRLTTKQVIMNSVYELAPSMKDHKVADATTSMAPVN